VEFALVSLPLFLLLIGLIDYGWILLKVQQINQAARAGVRAGITAGATEAKVRDVVNVSMSAAGLPVYELQVSPSDLAAAPAGSAITVRVAVNTNAAGIHLTGSGLIPVPPQLRASATMAKEGPLGP
jgi:Flp pilus assembly protein TadG